MVVGYRQRLDGETDTKNGSRKAAVNTLGHVTFASRNSLVYFLHTFWRRTPKMAHAKILDGCRQGFLREPWDVPSRLVA
jgi:hypothetical protein